ncbi:MAG: PAS domain S-box protein [Candidatus Kapaibacterium sp.]
MESSQIKVLIVENELVISTNLRLLLTKVGYTIAGITGFGEEVLQMLDTVEMDIILMDIGLSGKMDGIETAQKIREKKDIPVVFLTANTDHATFQRAKETQPYGYIHKPFDIMQIQASVEMAIARFEVEKSLNEQRTWLSTTLSSIGDGVIATDEYGAVKFMNAVAEKLTGYTQAEAAGRQLPEIFRIINEATREVVTNPVEIVLKERHTVGLANHTILIAKDGTEYNIDDAAAPIYDANSVITGVVLTFRDITEKYQTEARLAAAERQFRAMIEHSGDMVTMINKDRDFTYFSPATERISGYSKDEYQTLKPEEVFHPDDFPILAERYRYVRTHPGIPISYQYRSRKKNGEWLWLEGTVVNLLDDPKVGAIIANFRDITDRKNAEEKLHKSEELFRAMIENSKDGISIINRQGTVVYNSPSNVKIMGYTIEERMGKNFIEIVHPEDVPRIQRYFYDLLNGRERTDTFEARAKHKDGSWRWLEVSAENLLENPAIEAIVINFQDITNRKTAVEKLRKSEEKYRQVVSALQEGIAIQNTKAEIIDANDSAQRILGLTLDQLQGRSSLDPRWRAIHEDGSDYPGDTHPAVRTLSTGESISADIMGVYKPDGMLTWISINSEPLFKDGETTPDGVVVSFNDITERKVAEEELKNSNHRFEIVAKATNDGIWDHDLVAKTIWRNQTLCDIMNCEQISSTANQAEWFKSVHPDDYTKITELIQHAIDGDQSVWSAEYRVLQSDGSYRFYNDRGYIIRDSQGKAIRMIGALQDLTENKNAEEKLRKSEEKFRALVQNVTDVITLLDKDGIIIYQTPSSITVLGYDQDDLIGLSFFDRVHPDDREAVLQAFRTTLSKHGNGDKVEFRYRSKNNDYVTIESQGNNQLGNPEINAVIVTSRDMTERKNSEIKLRQSEEKFRMIMENTRGGVCLIDVNGKCLYASPSTETIFGYTVEEFMTIDRLQIIHPDNKAEAIVRFAQVLSGKELKPVEFRWLRKDGTWCWIESNSFNFLGNESINAIVAIYQDITDRHLAEQKIREQAVLLDVVPDAIFVRDINDVITTWSKGAEQMYGWNAAEAIGTTSPALIGTGEPSDFIAAKKILLTKGSWSGEFRQKTKDGKILLVQSRWKLLHNFANQPTSILVVNSDITEKKNLESQLFRAQRLESIGTLASGIAHDLNNVLTPVVLGMELIKLKVSDDTIRQRINTIIATVKRGSGLISQVLSFARGAQEERAPINIKYNIDEVVKIARETFPKEIDVQLDLPSHDLIIDANSTQIHQIILNLCINARDAMEEKGGILTIGARHIIADDALAHRFLDVKLGYTYVAITISDTGCGIPEELREKIFEPFFTTKEVGKGTGIGLTTVFSIVNRHDGFLDLRSEVNVGTSFTVYFPAVVQDKAEHVTTSPEIAESNHPETILLVDDEDLIRAIAEDVLLAYGYTVITAVNGADAVQMYELRGHEIDLVVTDVMMPVMNGIELITKLKSINPDVKTIGASGLMHGDTSKRLIEAGATGLLVKPYTADQLINAVREIIDK